MADARTQISTSDMHGPMLNNPTMVFYHSSIAKKNIAAATAVVLVIALVSVVNIAIWLGVGAVWWKVLGLW